MTRNRTRHHAFTLVEMLVVIAIIGVLVALLLPAVVGAINNARRARMALEIGSLSSAIEAYKSKTGDYPPSFRSHDVFIRHVRKCYPKIDPTHLANVEKYVWGTPPVSDSSSAPTNYNNANIQEGEALVFWLSYVDSDPRYPFKALVKVQPTTPIKLFDFDQTRLVDADGDLYASYKPSYAEETSYIYIDSRSYAYHSNTTATPTPDLAEAEDGQLNGFTQPYHATNSTSTNWVFINPTSFQLICAGQDGVFTTAANTAIKAYPSGFNYSPEDNDNITNFSEGKRLGDAIPQ